MCWNKILFSERPTRLEERNIYVPEYRDFNSVNIVLKLLSASSVYHTRDVLLFFPLLLLLLLLLLLRMIVAFVGF